MQPWRGTLSKLLGRNAFERRSLSMCYNFSSVCLSFSKLGYSDTLLNERDTINMYIYIYITVARGLEDHGFSVGFQLRACCIALKSYDFLWFLSLPSVFDICLRFSRRECVFVFLSICVCVFLCFEKNLAEFPKAASMEHGLQTTAVYWEGQMNSWRGVFGQAAWHMAWTTHGYLRKCENWWKILMFEGNEDLFVRRS